MENITHENYDEQIKEGTILVEVGAIWCGPCGYLEPILEEMSEQYKDQLTILKLDADTESERVQKLGVAGIPTLILYKDGREANRIRGFRGKQATISAIQPFLESGD